MTRERIEAILDVLEIEYRYHHFEECEAVNPPFMLQLPDLECTPYQTIFRISHLLYLLLSLPELPFS